MRRALLLLPLCLPALFAGCDGCTSGAPDAGPSSSALEAPGALARPPSGGLPDELRPPR